MKKFKSILALALVLGTMGSMAGCGGLGGGSTVNNDVEDTKNLKIMVINKGYGVNWLNKIAEAF